MISQLLTIDEVCKLLNRSRTWVWKQRKEGKLLTSKIDSRRFERAYIESLCKTG